MSPDRSLEVDENREELVSPDRSLDDEGNQEELVSPDRPLEDDDENNELPKLPVSNDSYRAAFVAAFVIFL